MMRNLSILAAAALVSAAFAQDVIMPGSPQPVRRQAVEVLPGSYIVTFAPGTPKNARALAAMGAGAQVRFNYDNIAAAAVTANGAALNTLRGNRSVVSIVPDRKVAAAVKPGGGGGGGGGGGTFSYDTEQIVPYSIQRVGPPQTGSTGEGIGVAVVDTGIDYNHPDLAPAPDNSGNRFNAVGPSPSAQDDAAHGTHISGLIAAQNNNIGIVGVAPGAKLYAVKVLNSALSGTDSQLIAGLDWVMTNRNLVNPKIRVVNASLGRPLDTAAGETLANSALRPIIQQLYNAGVVVVVSAGNDSTVEINQLVPAGFSEVISVASTTGANGIRTCLLFGLDVGPFPADTASEFTTDGQGVTVSAPGEEQNDIVMLGTSGCVGLLYGSLSTTMNTAGATRKLVGSFGILEARGTSFAAPLVAGTVARAMQKNLIANTANAAEVEAHRSRLQTTADRVNTAPLDSKWAGIFAYTFDGKREGIAQAPF